MIAFELFFEGSFSFTFIKIREDIETTKKRKEYAKSIQKVF